MTDDLVTRRDEMQARFDALGGWDGISDMLQNAMDRIESDAATIARLEAENAELMKAVQFMSDKSDEWWDECKSANATAAKLRAELDSASGLALTLQAECERLHGDVAAEAKVAALVTALERSADYIEKGMRDRSGPILRQARAAVTAAKEVK